MPATKERITAHEYTCSHCGSHQSSEWVTLSWKNVQHTETACERCARTKARYVHTHPDRR
jgi:transcription elongation factor Elf1